MERRFKREINTQIFQLRKTVFSEKYDTTELRDAWKTYLSVKERIIRPVRASETELDNIRKTVEMMDKGNLLAYTDETRAAYYSLWVDLGLDVIPGIIGNLSEEEKEKVASFAGKMSEVLIKKQLPS